MRWQVLAALTNGWFWLLAVLSTVVLVVGAAPVWLALMAGAAVLLGGATVQAAVEWRQEKRRRLGDRTPPAALADVSEVSAPDAQAVITRAGHAAERIRRLQKEPHAPTDELMKAQVAVDGAMKALHRLGRHIDQIDRALDDVNDQELRGELLQYEAKLQQRDTAAPELLRQWNVIREGLRMQLARLERMQQRREIAHAQMHSKTVTLEGIALRLSEIVSLYSAQDLEASTTDDLSSLVGELDDLRGALVDVENLLRHDESRDVDNDDGGVTSFP